MRKNVVLWLILVLLLSFLGCGKPTDNKNAEDPVLREDTTPISEEQLDTSIQKLSFSYSGPYPYRELGKQANDKGFAFYEKKDYIMAAKWFQISILHDSLNLFPHYNLACTLCLLGQSGKTVDTEEIFEELQICTGLDPTYAGIDSGFLKERFANDTDLDSIRSTKEFEVLVNRLSREDYTNPETLLISFGFSDKYTYYHFSADHTYGYAVTHQEQEDEGTWSLAEDGKTVILDCTYSRRDGPAGSIYAKTEEELSWFDRRYEFDRQKMTLTSAEVLLDTGGMFGRYYVMGTPGDENGTDFQLLAQLLSHGFSISNTALGDIMYNMDLVPLFDEIFYWYASPSLIRFFLGLPEATPEMVKKEFEAALVQNKIVEGYIDEKFAGDSRKIEIFHE